MRIFLSAYTIRVTKSGSKKENPKHPPQYCRLSSFDGHSDFRDVMEAFLKNLTVKIKNDTYKTYMKVIHTKVSDRMICGVVESGIYGLSNNLRDVETDSITYKKQKSDADVLPFYFLAYMPKDTDEGILILQRTGKYGIRSKFGIFLDKYFSENHRGFRVEVNPLIQEEIIKKILYSSTIKKLRCVKYEAPTDRFDGLDQGHEETPYNMEIVLSAARIPIMSKIKSLFETQASVKSLIELRDFNFDYDTIKVEAEVDGNLRIFDLGDLNKARNYYDISDQVKLDKDENPTFESINKITWVYIKDIIQKMYPSLT